MITPPTGTPQIYHEIPRISSLISKKYREPLKTSVFQYIWEPPGDFKITDFEISSIF
jgi:hypothetical protein